jgi:hypothetical protein
MGLHAKNSNIHLDWLANPIHDLLPCCQSIGQESLEGGTFSNKYAQNCICDVYTY